ncbi:hypothetical protein [Methylobacter sp.]|uniref:hypothetical protein n=1 Tax=Methylobacter sp. TaxID=2051955 RepID=UPI0024874DC1|nr:hypothetical protein [Methylobacter sp.]MDI1277101.1 hypothetical protein [Methylobacter sp.]MDI1357716.1 hypothetical protein [Methylobacter sp.]
MEKHPPIPDSLPSTEQLLLAGGDARLALDPLSGLNKYGCQPFPDPQLLAFGSSTASVISTEGFAAANRLRQKLLEAISSESHTAAIYAIEIQRIRLEWLQLCGLSDIAGLELIFAASGTDTHAIAAQYAGSGVSTPALVIMVEANETGSGVASALADKQDRDENPFTVNNAVEVVQVSIRLEDGTPRSLAKIDAEVEALASKAAASNRRVLLILVDQSKTGLIAPSPACVMALHHRFPDNIEVLVDACQFRIAMPTLRAYLEQGFMVALTGSKFLTAPSFSAVLLLPSIVAERLQKRPFPRNLLSCSSRANWPAHWTGAKHMDHAANFGLLLRCEVTLEELRRFCAVPQAAIINFLLAFSQAIQQRLTSDPHFEPLPAPRLDRCPLKADSWDHLQTIFPFLLYDPQSAGDRIPLSREQTLHIYQRLPTTFIHPDSDIALTRCQLGQPVACGTRHDIAVSALRLCLSSRLIIEAAAHNNKGITIIEEALKTLDKTALLIQLG